MCTVRPITSSASVAKCSGVQELNIVNCTAKLQNYQLSCDEMSVGKLTRPVGLHRNPRAWKLNEFDANQSTNVGTANNIDIVPS